MATNSPPFIHHKSKENDLITLDFRAPPPSPIGSRRSSSVTNDEVLTEFLEHSLRVPDLILPDRIFPKQKSLQEVHALDFGTLNDGFSGSKTRDSLAENGCFQVINHGISPELIWSVLGLATRMFRVPVEKKKMGVRSGEMGLGFEEICGEHEEVISEMSEEFVWGKSFGLLMKMEGVWPTGFLKFSEKMETLSLAIEKVGKSLIKILDDETIETKRSISNDKGAKYKGCICHIYKHPYGVPYDRCISSLRYDVIRMMIRGSEYPHSLSIHICDGSSEFHIYSKKGWLSFRPLPNALVVTAGDQLQTWSGGQYKHVIGRPIYTNKNDDGISMAFLYSPQTNKSLHQVKIEKKITLRQQALFVVFFTVLCQFLFNIYHKF